MTYGYYPGCSLQSTSREYDISLQNLCRILDIEIKEIEDWLCCGAFPGHATPRRLAARLAAYNLSRAQQQGMTDIIVPCPGCYTRIKKTWTDIWHIPALRADIEGALGYGFSGDINIAHPLEALSAVLAVRPDRMTVDVFRGMRAVCYYGCLLSRAGISLHGENDNAEYPRIMGAALQVAGIEEMEWGYSTVCCGGSLSLTHPRIALQLTSDILAQAREAAANAIIVACPLCQLNLDSLQRELVSEGAVKTGLPVLFYSQVLAIAFGAPTGSVGLEKHFISPDILLPAKAGLDLG